jgi:hypothetical protein
MEQLNQPQGPDLKPTLEQTLSNTEAVRDLFARAHDYIANASHPGHLGMKVAEVLNFLAFHHADFKMRGEKIASQIAAEAKAALNKVDVEAAKMVTNAVLSDEHGATDAVIVQEAPKV